MLNPLRDTDLTYLGRETAGIVDLSICGEAGLTEKKVRWLVDSGRWQYVHPRTIATFSGPLPAAARIHAAVIYAGTNAALSHETAGHIHGICSSPARIHVTVPYEREVAGQQGLVLHRSRTLTEDDLTGVPPTTKIERTVLDLLGHKRSADAALGLVADALRTRRTSSARLRTAVLSRRTTRWRSVLLDALPDFERGAESPLEVRDAALRRKHGLPRGERQVRRATEGVEFLDVLIAEHGLHIELDGRLGHDRAREQWRDMRRDNRSELAGLRHLRYGWADVVDRPCAVAIEQALVLRQQGWTGHFAPCRDCPRPLPTGL
jgi:hypothetical protein